MTRVTKSATRPRVACALLLGALTGCGGDSEGVAIEGRISYQEQAIENGSLTFFPAQGRPITAVLSEGGKYSCRLPAGAYRVAVTVGVSLPPEWKEGDPVPAQSITLPAEYGTRLKTPLTATVSADHAAPIDFALP